MASTIQIKRGSGTPGSLSYGELGVDTENKILYVGNTGGSVIELARNTIDGVDISDGANTITLAATPGTITYTNYLPPTLGANGQFLQTDGNGNLTWSTPVGSGDVSKVGTPADNQVGVWTGDGTIEGDAALTFDTTSDTLSIGATNDGTLVIGGVTIIDNGGASTVSLNNINSIDATTEATIEAAIDTLANLTSASSLATVGTITTGVWNGTAVTVPYGGTGATSLTSNAILTGNGTDPIQAESNLTFDGTTLTLTGDFTMTGDLVVNGNTTINETTTVSIEDSLIKLASNNVNTDTVDSGWYSVYGPTPNYAAIIRDATDGIFKVWAGLTTEPGATANFGEGALAQLDAVIDGGSY